MNETISVNVNEWHEIKSIAIENNNMLKQLLAEKEKELLTPKQVCEKLKISRDTFQRYVDKGLFTLINLDKESKGKKGSKVYVQRCEIDKLIEEGKV